MTARVSVKVTLDPAGERTLAAMEMPGLARSLRKFLLRAGFAIQTNVTTRQILPSSLGPVHPTRLTSRSGELRRSIAVDRSGLPFSVEVGTPLIYGPVHEFGNARTPPRPFLRPAVEEEARGFEQMLLEVWRDEVFQA